MRLIIQTAALAIAGSGGIAAGIDAASTWVEADAAELVQFSSENDAAMKAMMKGMQRRCSGSSDRDVATMMIARHQGAVDMALAEIGHGRNEHLRRLAQGIVIEQRQEIATPDGTQVRMTLKDVGRSRSSPRGRRDRTGTHEALCARPGGEAGR